MVKIMWLTALVCLLPLNGWSAIMSVEPSDSIVNVGDTFTVDLVADLALGESVLGWGLDLTFDDAVFSQIASPTIGSNWIPVMALDGDGLAGLAFPFPVSGTDVLLATLSFEAISVGTVNFVLGVTNGDLTEGLPLAFPAPPGTFTELTFNNASVTSVPGPSTILRMLTGLVGFAFPNRINKQA